MQSNGRYVTPTETITRRAVLRTAGAVGAATFGPGLAAGRPPALKEELDAVREATAAYRGNLDAARQDGWSVEGPFVPRMGYHYIDPGNVAAVPSDLDPTAPAVLVYDDPDDDQNLLAAEYLIHGNYTTDPPDLFSDENADVRTSEDDGWEYNPRKTRPDSTRGCGSTIRRECSTRRTRVHPTTRSTPFERNRMRDRSLTITRGDPHGSEPESPSA